MNHIFKIIGILMVLLANAQENPRNRVGIQTLQPKATLHISETPTNASTESQSQGVIFPHFSTERRAKFNNIEEGMLIYNTTKKCIEMYLGYYNNQHNWTCNQFSSVVTNDHRLSISPAGFGGSFVSGDAMNNNNVVRWTITNQGDTPVNNIDLRDAVKLYNGNAEIKTLPDQNTNISIGANQSITIEYRLTGTPNQGELKAVFNHIGLYAEQSISIGTSRAIIRTPIVHEIISHIGNQGIINNTNKVIHIRIPYSYGSGSYDAITSVKTTALGHNGDVNTLTLQIPAGQLQSNAGVINATITVSGNDEEYLVKLLNATERYDIATFPIVIAGQNINIIIRAKGAFTGYQLYSRTGEFTKNDCAHTYAPSKVTFSKEYVGEATSRVSQQDADNKALEEAMRIANSDTSFSIEGQDYANRIGICDPLGKCTISQIESHQIGSRSFESTTKQQCINFADYYKSCGDPPNCSIQVRSSWRWQNYNPPYEVITN